jgi:O-antigen/teichoic acid export membrane protein
VFSSRLSGWSVIALRFTPAGGLAVSSAVNLAALLLWVRLLPPTEFATLTLATTAALLVNALAFDWLRQASARILPDPTSPDGISRERVAAWIRAAAITFAAVVAVLVLATLLGLAPPGLSPRWNIAIFALAISEAHLAAITLVARLAFSPRRYAAIMVARSGLALLLGVTLIHFGGGAAGIIAGTALAQFLVSALANRRNSLWKTALHAVPHAPHRAALLRLGLPLMAGCALALLSATIDRTLVAAALGLAAAGHFAAPAELIGKALGFAFMAVNLTAYPLLVHAWERDGPRAATAALDRNLRTLLALGLPIAATATLAPHLLASLLLGPAQADTAAPLLPWLAAATLLRLLVAFHFGIALQLAKRMSLLLVPPIVTLTILVPLASPALHGGGLLRFVQLLCFAQAVGALSAWALASHSLCAQQPQPHRA